MDSELARKVARRMIVDYLTTSTMFWGILLISLTLSSAAFVYAGKASTHLASFKSICSANL